MSSFSVVDLMDRKTGLFILMDDEKLLCEFLSNYSSRGVSNNFCPFSKMKDTMC